MQIKNKNWLQITCTFLCRGHTRAESETVEDEIVAEEFRFNKGQLGTMKHEHVLNQVT